MQATDERLRGIIPEETDHRNLLLTTDIQLRLLGELHDEIHAERFRGQRSSRANELM
jgi:hypothetical protein